MISAALLLAAVPFVWQDHQDGRLELRENGATVLVYNYGPQLKQGAPADRRRCCYIFPLLTPAGVSVLDDFPADHWHHRGVFWAWPVVETATGRYALWGLRGLADRFERFLETSAGEKGARLAVENGWYVGERKIARETVRMMVYPARDRAREMDVELTLESLAGTITLRGSPEVGKSYGGLNARFGPRTATAIRADGASIEKDEDLNRHRSAELEGVYGGRCAMLRITADQGNPTAPHEWCLRHYGFVGASVQPLALQVGEPVTLRFRVLAADR